MNRQMFWHTVINYRKKWPVPSSQNGQTNHIVPKEHTMTHIIKHKRTISRRDQLSGLKGVRNALYRMKPEEAAVALAHVEQMIQHQETMLTCLSAYQHNMMMLP